MSATTESQSASQARSGDMTTIFPVPTTSSANAMSQHSQPDNAPPAATDEFDKKKFPDEIWKTVISNLPNTDLKQARLVNSAFSEFATPYLFEAVGYSPVAETHARILKLAKDENLAKHVRALYLDTASYFAIVSSATYAEAMARCFANRLGVDFERFEEGPLSPQNLLKVLRTDPAISLGESCLSSQLRKAFVAGYALFHGRGDAEGERLYADAIYKSLIKLLPSFKNLTHVETVDLWTPVKDQAEHFDAYLYHNLPATTFKLIPGLKNHSLPRMSIDAVAHGPFDAPGIAARRIEFMSGGPPSSRSHHLETVHEIVISLLRALDTTKTKLTSLSLPGSDSIGTKPVPKLRKGMLPISPLTVIQRPPYNSPEVADGSFITKNLALSAFENLKKLELQIDPLHPGTRSMHRYHMMWERLPAAIQTMQKVESLSIGYLIVPPRPGVTKVPPMSLYETILGRIDDFDDKEDTDEEDHVSVETNLRLHPANLHFQDEVVNQTDPNDPAAYGPPMTQADLNMFSALFGMAAGGAGGPAAVALGQFLPWSPPSTQPPATTQPASMSEAPIQGGTNSTSVPSQPMPTTATTAPDPLTAPDPSSANATGDGSTTQTASFSMPIPQDMVSSMLSVFGLPPVSTRASKMPAKEDILSPNPWPNLQELSLWNMPARPVDVLRLLKTVAPTLRSLELDNVWFKSDEYDQPYNTGPNNMPAGTAQGYAGYGPHPDPFIFDAGAPSMPPPQQTTNDTKDDEEEQWFALVEVLGDVLRLDSCDISLGLKDYGGLEDRLQKHIEGLLGADIDLDDTISHYIEQGETMGLAMFAAGAVKELLANEVDDESDEGEGGDEESGSGDGEGGGKGKGKAKVEESGEEIPDLVDI